MKTLLIAATLIIIFGCSKDPCKSNEDVFRYDLHTFSDSTRIANLSFPPSPATDGCAFELVDEARNGNTVVIDSIGVAYTANPNFSGEDEFTYTSYWCQEVKVDVRVWKDISDFCMNEVINLEECEYSDQSRSPIAQSTKTSITILSPLCDGLIESIEIIEKPTLGEAEVDDNRIHYKIRPVEGKDKIKIRICLKFDDETICNEKTYYYRHRIS